MGDKETRAKVVKLLEVVEDLADRQRDVLDEIQTLLTGGLGIGAKMKRIEDAFSGAWQQRYGSPYVFTYQKDRPHLKRLLKVSDVEGIEERIERYLANEDPFYAQARHPFGVFVTGFNRWAPDPLVQHIKATIRGCRHVPPCGDDAEHTRRRMAELRS